MKTKLAVLALALGLAAFLVALGTAVVLVASAGNGDNLQKAGQKVLQEKDRLLEEKRAAIDIFIAEITSDRIVTGEEMITLNRLIDDFFWAQKSANEELKFYNLGTFTTINQKMVDAVKNYYNIGLLHRFDTKDEAKRYFVALVGEDVVVERSGVEIAGGQIAFGVSLLVLLTITLLCFIGSRIFICGILAAFVVVILVLFIFL